MAALELADNPQAAADNRRITEHDPAMARLKARTARQLAASIQQLVDDLKSGVQPVQAQSHFIDRHLAILRAAYLAAHTEGQRDYYDAVSNTPQKWANHEADTATMQRRMAFYAPSVAKMAHEAVRAFEAPTTAVQLADMPIQHTGVMVAFMLKPRTAKALAIPGGEKPRDMHITLAFLGDSRDMDEAQRQRLLQTVQSFAASAQPLKGNVSGIGRFNPSPSSDGKVPHIAMVNVPGIQQWRAQLAQVLETAETTPDATFEYTPHITIAYADEDAPLPKINTTNVPLKLDDVTVAIGGKHYTFPLGTPAQLDDAAAAADDETVILYGVNRDSRGRYTFGKLASGSAGHGEPQHTGAGHVGEEVGAARGERSYGGLGFHRSGGGGGAGGASRGAAKVSRSQTMSKEQRAAAAAAKAAKRAANAKAGLANSGRPHSYPGYVRAHNAAEARGDKAMVAKLEKLYPQHEAERKSYHEQLGGHNRQALSQRRVATAKREDIISHDYRIKSYAEYQGVAKYHALHGNEDVLSALGTHRSLWLRNRDTDPARLYTQRQQAWRAYDQMMAQHERDTALSERPRRRSTSKAKVLSA